MSIENLDSIINPTKASKFGHRKNNNTNFVNTSKKIAEGQHNHDITSKREDFVGVVLRVEQSLGSSNNSKFPYEPGSFPMKKYRGKSSTPPTLVAVKVRIPELHYMLPVPVFTGSEDCLSKLTGKKISKCWHPIIDMYPTFYAQSDSVEIPNPGQIVRVRFGNLATREDPLYLGAEAAAGLKRTNVIGTAGGSSTSGRQSGPITATIPPPSIPAADLQEARRLGFDGKWGRIITSDRKINYQLTDADIFWAAKMLVGEGGHLDLTLWSMALKFVIFKLRGNSYGSSYYKTIRAYSQPINPLWLASGKFCAKGAKSHGTDKCSTHRTSWRAKLQSWTLSETINKKSKMMNLTMSWAKGQVRNPKPKVTDFALGSVTRKNVPVRLGGTCQDGDRCVFQHVSVQPDPGNPSSQKSLKQPWYVGTREVLTWPDNYVQIIRP